MGLEEFKTKQYSIDYMLLQQYKSSDNPEEISTQFIKKYERYLHKKASKYYGFFKGYHEYKDILQDMKIVLIETLNWLKPEEINNKDEFYITYALDIFSRNYFNKARKEKSFTTNIHTDNSELIESYPEKKNFTEEKQHYEEFINIIKSQLSKNTIKICDMYFLKQLKQKDIAKKMNMKVQGVSWHVCKVKKVMREEIKKNYKER